MYAPRPEPEKLSKKRIKEIADYILYNFYDTISGQFGIELDLTDEDDDYINDIREDTDSINEVLIEIHNKIPEKSQSKLSRFMNVIRTKKNEFHPITAFKISGMYEIPDELYNFKTLKVLKLIDGDIDEIPENINKLSSLVELNIQNCPNINTFPDTFSELTNLRTLEISGTTISEIPEFIVNLPKLETLILKNNPELREFPDSLIEKNKSNSFNLETDYSHFYKDKMNLENISDNEKSTLVLAINCHGLDLCGIPLNTKLNKLLYFSHAPKYTASIANYTCPSKNKINNLMDELNNDKNRISDVIEELEEVNSDVYDVSSLRDELNKYDELTEEMNDRLISYRTVLSENNSNLVFKVRAIKNDREYDFNEDVMEEYEGKFGIYILDIRNPKIQKQNNYLSIAKDLNSFPSKITKLSDILDICYVSYDFDYVAIIDMSCRESSEGRPECSDIKNVYKIRGEQLGEILEGRKPLREFKTQRLGGKSKKNKKRNSKKNNNKKSLKKKRNMKKTKKNCKK